MSRDSQEVSNDESRKEMILAERKKGNIVVSTVEGLMSMALDEFVKQPVDGMLYDLNRGEEIALTFIHDRKWVNDFAVALVIRKLVEQRDAALSAVSDTRAPEVAWWNHAVATNMIRDGADGIALIKEAAPQRVTGQTTGLPDEPANPEAGAAGAAPCVVGATRYRKRPVVIEAIKWTGDNLRDVIAFTGRHGSADAWTWEYFEEVVRTKGLKIFTLEGHHMATVGDYIIKGVHGEVYPCKPDIFAKTYDLANESAVVPLEPTNAMLEAGAIAHDESQCHDLIGPMEVAYKAMLAAAPVAATPIAWVSFDQKSRHPVLDGVVNFCTKHPEKYPEVEWTPVYLAAAPSAVPAQNAELVEKARLMADDSRFDIMPSVRGMLRALADALSAQVPAEKTP